MKFTGWKLFLISFLLIVPGILFSVVRISRSNHFDDNCQYYVDAASSPNIGTSENLTSAINNYDTAIKYAQDNALTTGFTTISSRTPTEDLSIWYKTLIEKRNYLIQLKSLSPDEILKFNEYVDKKGLAASPLQAPSGITIYPYNTSFFIWSIISAILGIIGIFGIFYLITEDDASIEF